MKTNCLSSKTSISPIGAARMLWAVRWSLVALCGLWSRTFAIDPSPAITSISVSNTQQHLEFQLYPGAKQYRILHAPSLAGPFVEDGSGLRWGDTWSAPLSGPAEFYRLEVAPMDPQVLLAATVLNRLAYGPTPDELDRVRSIGADAFIKEQLAPEAIQESLAIDSIPNDSGWQHYSATGNGSSSTFYVYLNAAGEGYIDDIRLVLGTDPAAGVNLLRNGDFEAPLATNDWTLSPNLTNSVISQEFAHSGTSSLKLIASAGGTTQGSSVWQTIAPALSSSKQYSLSFWFLRSTNRPSSVTVRLSGSGVVGSSVSTPFAQLTRSECDIDVLRSWHISHAVQSKKQLLEILIQFFENHFVTQYTKTSQYFDQFYNDALPGQLATQMEFREVQRWRQALLIPTCTFYDLLKISAESPAMIIYLDTVTSRGDGKPPQIANENYGRELLELFTFGVDNGYDQNDIVELSKGWTGWRVELVDSTNEFNPLASRLVDLHPGVNITNLAGVWAFKYRSDRHNNNSKKPFPGKIVPARFGPPYAGRSYELNLPARTGDEGLQDGYDIIRHVVDQPFTQEFVSVKLCRLLVHDDFAIGYDFTDPNLSPEGQLVRQCMNAWENGTPKGQIRAVLATIFNSDLFRSQSGSLQKVKTPLEFTVSALRALRMQNPDGSFTAQTDGNLGTILDGMGGMRLFDRAEPDGYPEAAAPWISAGTLSARLRFVEELLIAKGQAGRTDVATSFTDPVGIVKMRLSATDWNNDGAVADLFLNLLFPAEGEANLALYRNSALGFLNTADDGATASAFNSLSVTASNYDTRVRGMVAMLLTFQRFQEQ